MRTLSSLLVAFLLVLAVASTASAQTYTRFRLPVGTRLTVAGETYQGFNLGEYQELLRMDEDLRNLTTLHEADASRILNLTTESDSYRLALGSCDLQVTTLTAERERLTSLWKEENRLRRIAEASSWSWIPWSIAGVFLVSTITLAVVVGLQ